MTDNTSNNTPLSSATPDVMEYARVDRTFEEDQPVTSGSAMAESPRVVHRTVFVSARQATSTVSVSYRQGDSAADAIQQRIRKALQR